MNLVDYIRLKYTIRSVQDLDDFISQKGVNYDFSHLNKEKIIETINDGVTRHHVIEQKLLNKSTIIHILINDENNTLNFKRTVSLLRLTHVKFYVVENLINQMNNNQLILFINELIKEKNIDPRVFVELSFHIDISNINDQKITNIIKYSHMIKDLGFTANKLYNRFENNIYGYVHLINANIIDIKHNKTNDELRKLVNIAISLNFSIDQFKESLMRDDQPVVIQDMHF